MLKQAQCQAMRQNLLMRAGSRRCHRMRSDTLHERVVHGLPKHQQPTQWTLARLSDRAHFMTSLYRSFEVAFTWPQVNDEAVRLHLPDLRQAAIVSSTGVGVCTPGAKLRFDRESFTEAAKLTSLTLETPGITTLMPDCFTGLSALATLEMKACGLVSIPKALMAVASSLTSLALPLNNNLQLAADDVATLLALRKLQKLDLRKSSLRSALTSSGIAAAADAVTADLRYEPPLWSLDSLQHLVSLPTAFLALHGHALVLQVHE